MCNNIIAPFLANKLNAYHFANINILQQHHCTQTFYTMKFSATIWHILYPQHIPVEGILALYSLECHLSMLDYRLGRTPDNLQLILLSMWVHFLLVWCKLRSSCQCYSIICHCFRIVCCHSLIWKHSKKGWFENVTGEIKQSLCGLPHRQLPCQ